LGGEAANPKAFVVPGAVKETRVRNVWRRRGSELYAQLEKSSIWLFKMIPSGVMTAEPQYKLIATCKRWLFGVDPPTTRGRWLTRGERDDITPPIGSCQMGGAMIVQDDIFGRIVLCGLKHQFSRALKRRKRDIRKGQDRSCRHLFAFGQTES